MKNIIVTGASGFLGLRFCQILNEKGYRVRALIRNPEKSKELQEIAEMKVISDPWNKESLIPALLGIDVIIHLVGRAHIISDKSENSDELFKRINVDLTKILLEAVKEASVKRFVYISSVLAMGLSRNDILTETSICKPVTAYGRSKLEAENIIKEFSSKSKIDYTILRPPLVYGPRNKANMLKLFKLVAKELPIPLGEVSNSHSFIYIDNLVEATIAAIETTAAKGKIFLISDGENISTPGLIRAIANALGKRVWLVKVPLYLLQLLGKIGDFIEKTFHCYLPINTEIIDRLLKSLTVDNSEIKRITGWRPKYNLEQGLEITGKWFIENSEN